MKKVVIETWGCQMNIVDSEHMLAMLKNKGYTAATDINEEVDVVILHTCDIREKASHKIYSRLGEIKQLKEKNPNLKIVVSGCLAQSRGDRIFADAPFVDIVVGPGQIKNIVNILNNHINSNHQQAYLGFDDPYNKDNVVIALDNIPSISGNYEVSRYVNIIQGCENFCTFCVVPYVRGKEVSRTPEEIISEIRLLLNSGAKEIILLGQNVNSYANDLVRHNLWHYDKSQLPFVYLVKEILKETKLERLRFTTSNPHDFSRPIADLFKFSMKMGNYMHLPVQSGNDDILRKMNRKITISQYMEKIDWLRTISKDFAISTDIIVGFPSETEEQFQDTLALLEKVQFSFVFAFKFSPRLNTPAAKFKDQIPEHIKTRRLNELNKLQNDITTKLNQNEIGKIRQVLVAYPSSKEKDYYYGRTREFRLTKIYSTKNIVGQLLDVEIINANKTALVGRIVV